MIRASIDYFNYEISTKIDVKPNSYDRHPLFVSIVSVIPLDRTRWYDKKRTILMDLPSVKFCKIIEREEYQEREENLEYRKFFFSFMDCLANKNLSMKDMFNENIITKFDSFNNYSVILNNTFIELDAFHRTHAFNYNEQMLKGYHFFNLFHFSTINITNYITNKYSNDEEIFKISVKKFIVTGYRDQYEEDHFEINMLLSYYNTYDYKIEPILHTSKAFDQTIAVTKIIHSKLKPPFGECSDYSENRPFNSTNEWHCYRQCLKTMAQNKFKCKPVLIDNTLHSLDYIYDHFIECNSSVQRLYDNYVKENQNIEKCLKICPKDCFSVVFKMKVIRETEDLENPFYKTHYNISLIWDSTQPMFEYKEESVMSFIEYLCFCGGLVGLWFGTSAVDIIDIRLNKELLLNIWRLFLVELHYFDQILFDFIYS